MLLDAVLLEDNLYAAWQKVKENDGCAGVDGVTLESFGEKVLGRLTSLKSEVEHGQYAPSPLLRFPIPKSNGKLRYLAVPTVRDRVLQTAMARILSPILEKEFEECSYAYRAGRSVPMAVARIAHYRDQGFQWVVDADITHFFDEIDHALLLAKLGRSLPDQSPLPLIELWLAATVQPQDGGQRFLLEKGVPQGSPISPLLANIYLDDFDEALLSEHLRLVRFADDFLILCRDQSEAEDALELTESVVETLKLELNRDKTRITSFEEGFRFLGVNFIRNLLVPEDSAAAPWLIPRHEHYLAVKRAPAIAGHALAIAADNMENRETANHRELPGAPADFVFDVPDEDFLPEDPGSAIYLEMPELEPALRTLYVAEQGAALLKENDRILVAKDKRVLASIPIPKLDQIIVHGNSLVSTALLRACAGQGISVYLSGYGGLFAAMVDGEPDASTEIQAAQFERRKDESFRLMLASAFVHGKIHNCRVLLRRYNRRRSNPDVETAELMMAAMQEQLKTARNLDVVRGCEGQAARLYFRALAHFIPDEWRFDRRNRRPPADPINTLMSYGYAVLHKTVLTLIRQRRLNPWLGALHADKANHPALASDLMEEFRPLVIDTLVLQAVLSKGFTPADFEWNTEGPYSCQLSDEARKKFLRLLEAKFRARLKHPRSDHQMDYHRAIHFQVAHYTKVMLGQEPVYHPMMLR